MGLKWHLAEAVKQDIIPLFPGSHRVEGGETFPGKSKPLDLARVGGVSREEACSRVRYKELV